MQIKTAHLDLKLTKLDIITWLLLTIAFITASFDTKWTLEYYFTIRFSVLLLVPFAAFGLALAYKRYSHPFLWPLLITALANFAFVVNSIGYGRGLAYAAQFFYFVGLLFWAASYFENKDRTLLLYDVYTATFIVVFVWLTMYFVNLLDIKQPDSRFGWPRAYFYTFEPSYLSTYLAAFAGTFATLTCLNTKVKFRLLYATLTLLTVAGLFMSASRMGLILLPIMGLVPFLLLGILFKRTCYRRYLIKVCIGLLLCITTLYVATDSHIHYQEKVEKAFDGVFFNVGGTRTSRIDMASQTLEVAKQNVIIGTSFGGIPFHIAKNWGEQDISLIEAEKTKQGANVFAESLAALGVPVFMVFCYFFGKLIYVSFKPLFTSFRKPNTHEIWTVSLAVGFLFEIFLLQFNQNIFRMYFWLHILVWLVSVQAVTKYSDQNSHYKQESS